MKMKDYGLKLEQDKVKFLNTKKISENQEKLKMKQWMKENKG